MLLWSIAQASYLIMCLFRTPSLLSFLFFEVFLILGIYYSVQLLSKQSLILDREQDLPEFIIDLCNQLKFEEIEVQRSNFNFEMMVVSKEFEKIHTHSIILGKLITAKNSRLYLMNMICTLVTSFLWLSQCILVSRPLCQGSPSNTVFYFFDSMFSIMGASKLLFLFPLLSCLLLYFTSYELLIFCTAVHRQLTLRQLRNLSQ